MKKRKEKMKLMIITILGVLVALVAIHKMNAQDLIFRDKTITNTQNVIELPLLNVPSDSGNWTLDSESIRLGGEFLQLKRTN